MSTQKRCHYEVLALPQSCTQDDIRAAYKKLALQRHPDKLVQSGLSSAEATAAFQELVHAYEVLSDPKERSWYDNHRSQILFSNPSESDSVDPVPNLFSYFSSACYTDYTNPKTGFYRVYGDVFGKVYANEVNYARRMGLSLGVVKEAPLMGDLKSDYSQANAFYGYWMGFSTVMDFGWVDKWDAAAGVNRKSRRVMEEENKKLRKRAKKEYNETVRGLAEFAKKRDKRVIDMMVRKEKEREKKREEEMMRRKEMERERLERARTYEEPEWTRVEEEEVEDIEEEQEQEKGEQRKEFYCVACGKKFKSDKQWKNHEQSKKHKEKVAKLRKSFIDEEDLEEVEEENRDDTEVEEDTERKDEGQNFAGRDGLVSAEDSVDELGEKFRNNFGLEEERARDEFHSEDEDGINNAERLNGKGETLGSDDETNILEAMVTGRAGRKTAALTSQHNNLGNAQVESEDETEFVEYNSRKGSKKSRRAKRGKGKNYDGQDIRAGRSHANVPDKENNGFDGTDASNGSDNVQMIGEEERSSNTESQASVRKGDNKRDADDRSKKSLKGRKQKAKSKNSAPACEQCGEEFESRNRLHKHLIEMVHATLKSK